MSRVRRPAAAALLLLLIGMSACDATPQGTPGPSQASPQTSASHPTPSPGQSPTTEAPSTPSATSDASPSPAANAAGFAFAELLRVTADGLAVRRAPTLSGELVHGAAWDQDAQEWIGTGEDVRLGAGHQVRVMLGPIQRDGVTWYRVLSFAQPGQDSSEEIRWDADNDAQFGDEGWIAARQGDQTFVEAIPDSGGEHPWNPPLAFAAGDSGVWESEPFTATMMVAGDWAFVTDDLAPCNFEVILEPIGEVLVSESLIGVVSEGNIASSTNLASSEYTLRVTAGVPGSPEASCSWALMVGQVVG